MKTNLWVLIFLGCLFTVIIYFVQKPTPVTAKKHIIRHATYDAVISGEPPGTSYGNAPLTGDLAVADVLIKQNPAKPGQEQIGHIDAQKCYEMDFMSQNNRTGNYAQVTNNYKHSYPDSCTGTRQEMIGSFYA